MRFAAFSDLHLWNHSAHGGETEGGLNARAKASLAVLKKALNACRGCHVFIPGDIFDRVRPEPQLLEAVRTTLRSSGPESVTLLVGNHDRVSAHPNDHALGPLVWPDEINVVTTPEVIRFGEGGTKHEILCVPHVLTDNFSAYLQKLITDTFRPEHTGTRILVMHAGIYDSKFPAWAQESKGALSEPLLRKLCASRGISVVWSGDWHQKKTWDKSDVHIKQLGTLIPHSWSDAGCEYGFISQYDTSNSGNTEIEIPGPRFIENDLATACDLATLGMQIYYREYAPAEQLNERLHTIRTVADGRFHAIEVLPLKTSSESLTKRAALVTSVEAAVEKASQAFDRSADVSSNCLKLLRGEVA